MSETILVSPACRHYIVQMRWDGVLLSLRLGATLQPDIPTYE